MEFSNKKKKSVFTVYQGRGQSKSDNSIGLIARCFGDLMGGALEYSSARSFNFIVRSFITVAYIHVHLVIPNSHDGLLSISKISIIKILIIWGGGI